MKNSTKTLLALGVTAAFAAAVPGASASIVDVDVTGVESWDAPGSANNTVLMIDLAAELGLASGSSVTITGVGWDAIGIETVGLSWLSEATVSINGEINLAPSDVGAPGVATDLTSDGIISLADAGLADVVLADGILMLEFFESYDDIADSIDAIWTGGTLSFETAMGAVPLPAALPLLLASLGGLLVGGRRRRVS